MSGVGIAPAPSVTRFVRSIDAPGATETAGNNLGALQVVFYQLFDALGAGAKAAEVDALRTLTLPLVVYSFSVRISANGTTTNSVLELMKNGVATGMKATVILGSNGVFPATGGPVTFAASDTVSLRFTVGATAGATVGAIEGTCA